MRYYKLYSMLIYYPFLKICLTTVLYITVIIGDVKYTFVLLNKFLNRAFSNLTGCVNDRL